MLEVLLFVSVQPGSEAILYKATTTERTCACRRGPAHFRAAHAVFLLRRPCPASLCACCLPPLAPVLVCVGAAVQPVCLVAPGTDCGSALSYEQRPRASCLCHWGDRLLYSAPVRAGPNPIWPGGLGRQAAWEQRCKNGRQCCIPGDGAAAAGGAGGERRS
jgi:hypothetical protein